MRPVIGITCAWSEETWGREATKNTYDYAGRNYGAAIYRVGGLPVLIPPVAEHDELDPCVEALLQRVDGVYFSGGGDVRRKPGTPIPVLYEQQPARSRWEDALLKEVYRRDIPTLGVCRGYQMMAVAFGGAMDTVRMPEHLQSAPYHLGCHHVSIAAGSLLSRLAGPQEWFVNSIHVERVTTVPDGFAAAAWAEDGSIEAIEACEKRFFLGTQFHPELMTEDARAQRLLRAFVAAAER